MPSSQNLRLAQSNPNAENHFAGCEFRKKSIFFVLSLPNAQSGVDGTDATVHRIQCSNDRI